MDTQGFTADYPEPNEPSVIWPFMTWADAGILYEVLSIATYLLSFLTVAMLPPWDPTRMPQVS